MASKNVALVTAYTSTFSLEDASKFVVVICEKGVDGYRVVPDYGPYDDREKAAGVAQRLNARKGLTEKEAAVIVASTMPFLRNKKSRA